MRIIKLNSNKDQYFTFFIAYSLEAKATIQRGGKLSSVVMQNS